jgi:hypothetical protein
MPTTKEKPKAKLIKSKTVNSLLKDKELRQEREALLNDKEDYRF